ncbi:MAG: type II toxin-antitoxin system Phd/YefM family antitoxin [Caulobacteraceae bacterium]
MDHAISASEANQRFSKMLRDVQRGDSYVVTSRGRPVARIIPIDANGQADRIHDLLNFLRGLPDRDAGHWRREDLYP